MSHNLSPSDQRRTLRRNNQPIPAALEPAPIKKQFFAGPSRLNARRYAIVAADNTDGGRAVAELRHVIGCWPYETAWMEAPSGATVLAHEGEAIATELTSRGWERL